MRRSVIMATVSAKMLDDVKDFELMPSMATPKTLAGGWSSHNSFALMTSIDFYCTSMLSKYPRCRLLAEFVVGSPWIVYELL